MTPDPRLPMLQMLPSRELMQAALSFYESSPDGQYDYDVVVPVLKFILNTPREPGVTGKGEG